MIIIINYIEIFDVYKYELNSSILLKKEGSGLSLAGISLNGVFFRKKLGAVLGY